jgi:hypothetical protein
MAYPVSERLRRARATRYCVPGLCLNRVRRWIGVPAKYPSARKAWEAIPHSARHTTRGNIPKGVPVWLDRPGGTRFGHIVLAMGEDAHGHPLVASTDYPSRGRVSIVRLDTLEQRWGMRMLGWAHTLNGRAV